MKTKMKASLTVEFSMWFESEHSAEEAKNELVDSIATWGVISCVYHSQYNERVTGLEVITLEDSK